MKRILCRTAFCLIALVGSAFGSVTAHAETPKESVTAVVEQGGTTVKYTSDKMNKAWNDAENSGGVIKLMNDWKPESAMTVPSGKSLTLDLNGHIIDRELYKYESGGAMFIVQGDASLSIIDSSPDTVHNGLAVRGGILTGGKSSNTSGCIDMQKGSTVKIEGCSIMSCATQQDGAAVRMDGVCELTAEGTGFYSNYTQDSKQRCYGGAIYVGDGTAFIRSCTFDGNYCEDHGGAIYMNDGELQIENSMFRSNAAGKQGGAIYCDDTYNNSMIQGCTFVSNTAEGNGGAISVVGCKQLVMYNSIFSLNSTNSSGGAIYVESDKVILANSTVTANKAKEYGGGVFVDSLHDIGVQGKVIVRNNKNGKDENNDLCLQSGRVSTAYLSNGGLYDGSMIYITSTTTDRILAAKQISKYQSSLYIRANKGSAVIDESTTEQVEEKFISSAIGKGSLIAIFVGVGALAVTCVMIVRKKKLAKGEKNNDAKKTDE